MKKLNLQEKIKIYDLHQFLHKKNEHRQKHECASLKFISAF